MGELKEARTRREEEARRANDDLRGLKDLIQRSLSAQKESTDGRLQELHKELKGLKTLVGNRMSSSAASTSRPSSEEQPQAGASTDTAKDTGASRTDDAGSSINPATPTSRGAGAQSSESHDTDTKSPAPTSGDAAKDLSRFSKSGIPVNRAAIPAWQLAAAPKDKEKDKDKDSDSGSNPGSSGRG